MTIRHLVMWTLKNPQDAAAFKAELDSCVDLVTGMLHFHVALKQDGLEANVDILLDSTFAVAAALAAYQTHPHHQAVSARLGPLRNTRHVMDYSL